MVFGKTLFHGINLARAAVPALGRRTAGVLLLCAGCLWAAPPAARANVYATNLRINGSTTDTTLYYPCFDVEISYILNEPASDGLTIDFLDGETVVHSLFFPGGSPGAARGAHVVAWDGKDDQGNDVPKVTYTVRMTAAAAGYSEWSLISDDFNPGNYVWDPTSIAVNRNTSSPEYGRVFVANASPGPFPEFNPGDQVGLLKLNADGSEPADGPSSTGGWAWAGDGTSPWKIEVSADDDVYVNDWTHNQVLRFDQHISPGSRRTVLRRDNRPAGASFGGLSISGHGVNAHLSMADTRPTNSLGIRRWRLNSGGVAESNDLGVTLVEAGPGSDLSVAPYDVAEDPGNHLHALQYREAEFDSAPRVLRFPSLATVPPPQTNADWTVGSGNNAMRGASGVATDPKGRYAAVAFAGTVVNGRQTGGRTTVFDADSGAVVTHIVTGFPGGESHDHLDVAWDNVGNLYLVDNYESVWRAYSPPGSNSATTYALGFLRLATPPLAPILKTVGYANGQFSFTLTGRTNLNYIIDASADLVNWSSVATNSDVCATRLVTVAAPQLVNFYRAWPEVIPVP